jgi:adenylate kinase
MSGPNGSGKGTQSQLLSKKFNFDYFEMGAELREMALSDDKLDKTLKSGNFAPESIVCKVFKNKFETFKNGLVLDGFPRSLGQANFFLSILDDYLVNTTMIMLDVSTEVVVERMMSRSRNDDTEETIKKRLELYRKETLPSINYLADRLETDIFTINGNQTQDKVVDDIDMFLSKIAMN